MHSGRMVKGWPESWRPESLFGLVQGSYVIVNIRLTGEIHLDAFTVNHTKDDIEWFGDEQERVEEALKQVAADYREVARNRRREPRTATDLDVQLAVQELEAELASSELVDLLELTDVPTDEAVHADNLALLASVDSAEPTFQATVGLRRGPLSVIGYLDHAASPNDPYVTSESTSEDRILILINMNHPHIQQIDGSGLLNYFRHCTYDAIAEWQANTMASTTDPGTIKRLKDQLLRLVFAIEMHQST